MPVLPVLPTMASKKFGDTRAKFENNLGKIHYKVNFFVIIIRLQSELGAWINQKVKENTEKEKYFQVRYDNATGSLNVTVVECQSLKKMDTFGKSDPFVRVYLLPGTHEVVKTEVIKKNLNPYFNENFKFTVNIN